MKRTIGNARRAFGGVFAWKMAGIKIKLLSWTCWLTRFEFWAIIINNISEKLVMYHYGHVKTPFLDSLWGFSWECHDISYILQDSLSKIGNVEKVFQMNLPLECISEFRLFNFITRRYVVIFCCIKLSTIKLLTFSLRLQRFKSNKSVFVLLRCHFVLSFLCTLR